MNKNVNKWYNPNLEKFKINVLGNSKSSKVECICKVCNNKIITRMDRFKTRDIVCPFCRNVRDINLFYYNIIKKQKEIYYKVISMENYKNFFSSEELIKNKETLYNNFKRFNIEIYNRNKKVLMLYVLVLNVGTKIYQD